MRCLHSGQRSRGEILLVSSVTKAPSADAQDVPQYSWTRPLDSVKRGFALHLMHKGGAGASDPAPSAEAQDVLQYS